MLITRNQALFALTLTLFAALAFMALRSGARIFETGPELVIYSNGGPVVFVWHEAVEAPMAHRFHEAFEAWKDKTDHFIIDLDSPGGALIEGRGVIDEIERMKATHRIDTRVGPGATCASMCVPIFIRGLERVAAADARFMFHEPTSVDFITEERVNKPAFEHRRDAKRFFDRYFVQSEMDPAWLEKLREASKGRDVWKTSEELVAEGSNVVTKLE